MQFNQSLKANQQDGIQIIDQKHRSGLPPQLDQQMDNIYRAGEDSPSVLPLQPRSDVARRERDGRQRHEDSIDYQLQHHTNFIYSELPSSARDRSHVGLSKGRSSLQM